MKTVRWLRRTQPGLSSMVKRVLNEPHGASWSIQSKSRCRNSLLADALNIIRDSNPLRAVIIGSVGYNNISRPPAGYPAGNIAMAGTH